MRDAAARLVNRPRSAATSFARGTPEPIAESSAREFTATLYDLLSAYAAQRQKQALVDVRFAKRTVWSLNEAREALERLIGTVERLDARSIDILIAYLVEPGCAPTVIASSFAREPRTGARGHDRDPSGGGVRAALSAQAQPKETRAADDGLASADAVGITRRSSHAEAAMLPTTNASTSERERRPGSRRRPEELRMVEALLFAAAEPLGEKIAARALAGGRRHARRCAALQADTRSAASTWCGSAGKWTFRTAGDLAFLLSREAVEQKKLSRAALETLAIIAYHQPVTRAEIEDIRGVDDRRRARSTC